MARLAGAGASALSAAAASGQMIDSIHSRAASSLGNMSITSMRLSPSRCALPGALCAIRLILLIDGIILPEGARLINDWL